MPLEALPTGGELHGFWLVCRREYLQRVQSISFLASTLAAPLLFLALAATPMLLERTSLFDTRPIVLVCSEPRVRQELEDSLGHQGHQRYLVKTAEPTASRQRQKLLAMVLNSQIGGLVWLDNNAVYSGRITYISRFGLDPLQRETLRTAITWALIHARMAQNGLTPDDIRSVLRPVKLDSITLTNPASGPAGSSDTALVITAIIITALEVSLLSYGIVVMRSVLEDKTSRVAEILLCSVTPRALMAGKILGIGGVSLTQVLVWAIIAVGGMAIGAQAFHAGLAGAFRLNPATLALFVIFYVLGYLLYSALYAAVGAAFNTVDEAQYWNLLLTLPLLFSGLAVWLLFGSADSPTAVALSLAPPSAPLMMSMRIALGVAPIWQICASLVLLTATVYGVLVFSARVYRVGLLMYGKRPTLREIARWLFSPI